GATNPLIAPLYQSAVYTIPDIDTLDRISNGEAPGFVYARDAHPNARRLAALLAALEGAAWGVVCGSGMAAISAIVLATGQAGGRIIASNRLYGRTTQLFQQEFGRFGVATTFVDTTDLEQVAKALEAPARLLFVETMSNPLLRVADLARLAALAKKHGCLLAV